MAVSLFCGLHFSLETFREEQRIRRVGKRLAIVSPLAVWTEKFSDWVGIVGVAFSPISQVFF